MRCQGIELFGREFFPKLPIRNNQRDRKGWFRVPNQHNTGGYVEVNIANNSNFFFGLYDDE